MKTTLMIPDGVYKEIKRRAAESGRSISDLVSELLLAGLRPAKLPARSLPPLPSFDMGKARVNLADRNALEDAMRPRH